MDELVFSGDAERALKTFEVAGGVVRFVLLDAGALDRDAEETHREAVVATVEVLRREAAAHNARISAAYGVPESRLFRFEAELAQAIGTRIALAEFLGPHYDLARGRLVMRGNTPAHLNDYFVVGDAETPENVRRVDSRTGFTTSGFAHAFSEPPYRLTGGPSEVDELFADVVTGVFGGLDDVGTIYSWSTDWSTYFTTGREWWGAFLWTVARTSSPQIVAVVASSTD